MQTRGWQAVKVRILWLDEEYAEQILTFALRLRASRRAGPLLPLLDWHLFSLGILAENEEENRPRETSKSFAMMVPEAGIEPALPLPGKGF
jgi:hypothetical protein